MSATSPTYRDIYIDKGTDFSEEIRISVPFDEYDFTGTVRSSVSSLIGVPISFAAVENEPKKMVISIPGNLTATLKRYRGVYSIVATHKISQEEFVERQGTAHYSQAPTFVPAEPPPPNYVVSVENIEGLGSAATADVEDFKAAEEVRHDFDALNSKDYLGRAPVGSLEADAVWSVTRLTIASNGSVVSETSNDLISWTDRADNTNYI